MSRTVTVVTGATSGIGLATAQRLAAHGRPVYLVGRDPERTRVALARVHARATAPVTAFLADLASQRAVRSLATELAEAMVDDRLVLGALVHAAGLYSSRRVRTEDGVELTFAVNHLAPFLLTHDLLTALPPSPSLRIVVVGSHAHHGVTLDPERVADPRVYVGLRAYKQSKLANELFVRELARRWTGTGVGACTVDPGLVDTGIGGKHSGLATRLLWRARRRLGTPADVPARTIEALCTGALGIGSSGTSWRDGQPVTTSDRARDDRLARHLWLVSCARVGIGEWPTSSAQPPERRPLEQQALLADVAEADDGLDRVARALHVEDDALAEHLVHDVVADLQAETLSAARAERG